MKGFFDEKCSLVNPGSPVTRAIHNRNRPSYGPGRNDFVTRQSTSDALRPTIVMLAAAIVPSIDTLTFVVQPAINAVALPVQTTV